MDPFFDPRIAAAEARHARRRRRSARIFAVVDHVFYWALLLAALGVLIKLARYVWPYVL